MGRADLVCGRQVGDGAGQLEHPVIGARREAVLGGKRCWLLMDIDPRRPSGISSTDTELAAAGEACLAVNAFLSTQGWPDPVIAMSSNGYYALYRLGLPNDQESTNR